MAEYQDLLKDTSQSYDNGDYFIVTIPGLIPGTIYPLEFRWKYKDGTFGEDWSAVKVITAPAESIPQPPSPAVVTYSQGIITVKWDGKNSTGGSYPATLDKIEVYIKWAADADNLYISKGSIPATGGSINIPVLPGDYNIKLRSVSKTGAWSGFNQVVNVTAKADAPIVPTSIVPAWSGTDFTIGFNSNPAATGNEYLSFYLIKLTANDGTTRDFTLRATNAASQKFALSLAENTAAFGVPQTSFSGSVSTVDVYGNIGTAVTFGAHVYVNNLPAPTITVTEAVEGYTVAYTTPADKTFSSIEIQEVESTATNDPAFGYETCFSGSSNPVVITRSNQNKRWVRARFIANNGSAGQYGTAVSVTPKSVVVADLIPPTNPTGIGAVATVDAYDQTGFSLSSRISWTASTDTSTRGYRLRWSPDNPATVPNPNWEYGFTNASSFTASGLIPNVTYYYQVASVDQYNNTQTYSATQTFTAADSAATAVNAAARLKSILAIGGATGDLFKFGTGIPDSINTSITTTPTNSPSPVGGYHGILLNKTGNKNNYWLTTGQLRVGTDTQFMYFNGTNLYLTGNINAASGSFTGSVNIANGGSLYSGAIVGGNLSGAGYILNSSGLTFNSAGTNGITTINGTTGKLTTASASIGNWDVTSSAISKTSSSGTLTLNSSTAQITAASSTYQAGIATPNTNSPSDIVFWAGGSRSTSAPFYVRADGSVVMTSATITGYAQGNLSNYATTTALSTGLAGKINAAGAAADVNSNTTTISGGKIRAGVIESGGWIAPTTGVGGTSPFSVRGMQIVLDGNGSIIGPQFYIDSSGGARFKGNITGATGTFNGSVSGGSFTATDGTNTLTIAANGAISNSSGKFSVSSAGVLSASGVIISGDITANNITAGSTISGVTFTASKMTAGETGTSYYLNTRQDKNGIESLVVNAIGIESSRTGGVSTHWYPYFSGTTANFDLGIIAYPWNDGRFAGNLMVGYRSQDGTGTTSPGSTAGPRIKLNAVGTIFANTLGTASTSNFITQEAGFLRVNTSSSRRYKNNIVDIDSISSLNPDLLLNIPVRSFIYNDDHLHPSDQRSGKAIPGFIAEEVEEFYPLAVDYNSDGVPERWNTNMIVPGMLALIQKQHAQIEILSNRLDALEG
jgi:hypothetical protein